jgi:hippurate hydrolase
MICILVAGAFLLVAWSGRAQEPRQEWVSGVPKLTETEASDLVELYKHLHQNPELSFEEAKTSARMAEELRACGFEVTTGVGGHGVVGLLRNGSGPTVLVRTDLDALPIEEATGLPYSSKVRAKSAAGQDAGVMHACGHDVHMAVWTGTARLLTRLKVHWQGNLVMIAQPAEERAGGAKAMLKDGLFERWPPPDFALALHVDSQLETGKVGWTSGYALANVDTVDIVIRGVGGHGAYPHLAKDPIVLASQTVLALQTIVSREIRPLDSAVVTVGSIHGGTKHNIIPEDVRLQLTVRCYSDTVRDQILRAIRRIAEGQARAAGIPEDRLPLVTVNDEERTPAMFNDPDLCVRVVENLRLTFGPEAVVERPPEMGAEDFAYLGRARKETKAFMFRLGTVPPDLVAAAKAPGGKPLPSVHSAFYAPDPLPSITTGVRAMTAAVLASFRR